MAKDYCFVCRTNLETGDGVPCRTCIADYLTCYCGQANPHLWKTAIREGKRGVIRLCVGCGELTVNTSVKATGLEPTSFDHLDIKSSIIRKRICQS